MSLPDSQTGRKYEVLAEINMIPLIDVSLVLLIIFMVMTPLLVNSKIKINLPNAASAEKDITKEKPAEIQIDKDGGIFLNGTAVQAEELENQLRLALPDPASGGITIQADKDVPFQKFIAVADAGRKVGVIKFGIAVKPEPSPK
jgi:biopolymer transport protein TolR